MSAAFPPEHRWLLLLQQLPRSPQYLRVKVWRRLQRLGAVAVKNAVYALPLSEEHNEDLQWIVREIVAGGGEAAVVEASFIQGISDAEIAALFTRARDADYAALDDALRALARRIPRHADAGDQRRRKLDDELARLERRFAEIVAIDFLSASGQQATRALIENIRARLDRGPATEAGTLDRLDRAGYQRRTWVTRKGLFVDRIGSAWLIRRFIDPKARFKFVVGKGYAPRPRELRFDMFDAEFTHVGDRCTFEVLCERFALDDPALSPIAEIVHDIDIKDKKFAREEAAGVERLLAGIAVSSGGDEERLRRGSTLFEDLYEIFKRTKGKPR